MGAGTRDARAAGRRRAPWLVERINAHFGHRAVAHIKLRQLPVGRRGRRSPQVRLSEEEAAQIDGLVAAVGDTALRQRLARIGRTLYALDKAAIPKRR